MTNKIFSRPLLTALLAACFITALASFIQPTKPNAPKPSVGNLPNNAALLHMGNDAKYTYYIYAPIEGNWTFERIELSKATDAAWVK